jgi:hypothetical protein
MRQYNLAISHAVEQRLASLGDTADDVALALWIRGRKGLPPECLQLTLQNGPNSLSPCSSRTSCGSG